MNSHKWEYIDGVVYHCVWCDKDSDWIIGMEWEYGLDCDGIKDEEPDPRTTQDVWAAYR